MLAGQLGLFGQVPSDLQWQIGVQIIGSDMGVGCIRNAAIPDLRYDLPPFHQVTGRHFYICDVNKYDELILGRENLNG